MIPPTVLRNSDKVPASNSAMTILFAEEHEELKEFVEQLLHRYGYRVIAASDGKDALRQAREFDGIIDLLLSDIEMPGMTGIELAIQLNQERPETKILLISSLDSGMLILNGGWQFLPNPFLSEMLRDKIRDFLTEQPQLDLREQLKGERLQMNDDVSVPLAI